MSKPTSNERLSPNAWTQARQLRGAMTGAETALWRVLRDRRLVGMKWRRQVPIGRYIVDFVCLEHRLVVECDGSQHDESVRDAVRDAWLEAQGFRVVRFWNNEVLGRRENVIETILARCGLPF